MPWISWGICRTMNNRCAWLWGLRSARSNSHEAVVIMCAFLSLLYEKAKGYWSQDHLTFQEHDDLLLFIQFNLYMFVPVPVFWKPNYPRDWRKTNDLERGCCHVIKNGPCIGRFVMCSIILSTGPSSETKDYWPDSLSRWTPAWPSIWSNSRITWQYGSITVECFSTPRGSFEEYCSGPCLRPNASLCLAVAKARHEIATWTIQKAERGITTPILQPL
jgi:hypothetical protein